MNTHHMVRCRLVLFLTLGTLGLGFVLSPSSTRAQATREPEALPEANAKALKDLANRFQARFESRRGTAYRELLKQQVFQRINANSDTELMGVDESGRPIIYTIHNVDAAETHGTQHLHPGGITGYDVDGSTIGSGNLAVWDGGSAHVNHQEYGGRAVLGIDSAPSHYHAAHVGGTIAASGVDPLAKGMAPAATLYTLDWTNDESEMANGAALGLQVSNHSYGSVLGWDYDSGTGIWTWHGDTSVNANEDWLHGFYNAGAADWDAIMAASVKYLIVKSAGNDNGDAPSPTNTPHDHIEDGSTGNTDSHNADCSTGFDCLGAKSTAKNPLVVGSVEDIPGGYTQPSDVVIASYSSAGPTDDGRIKPDIVANGEGLYSIDDVSNTAYATRSGTSMAAPTATGTIALLTELFEARYGGRTPRSATLKAAVIHSAFEAGSNPGPDYVHGWGLLNAVGAADLIMSGPSDPHGIAEWKLLDGETHTFEFERVSNDFKVTLVWTDPAGTPVATSLDPTTPMLVNNLDLRVQSPLGGGGSQAYLPWVMNPASPASAPTRGINSLDNVEQVSVSTTNTGTFSVIISHQGTLQGGQQQYSLVWEGLEPVEKTPVTWGDFGFDNEAGGAIPGTYAVPDADVGIVIETLKPVELEQVTIPLLKLGSTSVTVNVYEWSGGATGTRGALVASGSSDQYLPGFQEFAIPVSASLSPCTQYNIAVEVGDVSHWGGYLEGPLALPFRANGAFMVLEGEEAGDPSATRFPRLTLYGTTTGTQVVDLDPGVGTWSGSQSSTNAERTIKFTAERTRNLSDVAWHATANGNQLVTARLYDWTGGVQGDVLAEASAVALNGSTLQTVPISHLLLEGKQYELGFTFSDMTYETNTAVPAPIPFSAGGIRVESFSHFLIHTTLALWPGIGGDTFLVLDLGSGEQTLTSAGPWGAGVFAEALGDHTLHSLGWLGDVQEGEPIQVRVYEATGTTRGTLLAGGTFSSTGSGEQWHDLPLYLELSAGQEVEFEVVLPGGGLDGAQAWPAASLPAIVPNYEFYAGGGGLNRVPTLRIGTCNSNTILAADPDVPSLDGLRLMGASSNPLRGAGTVRFSLGEPGPVRLDVVDVRGRRVRTLLDSAQPAGAGEVAIDTRGLAAGMYFLALHAAGETRVQKLTVVH